MFWNVTLCSKRLRFGLYLVIGRSGLGLGLGLGRSGLGLGLGLAKKVLLTSLLVNRKYVGSQVFFF